jgi:hypothetical protein
MADNAGAVTLMHIFPVQVEVGEKVAAVWAPLPWGAPAVFWLAGTSVDGEPMVRIASEWPLSWVRTVEPLPKRERETLCLRRFGTDATLARGGAHPFYDLREGDDPPDATVETGQGRIGIELTTLALEDRRPVNRRFGELRAELERREPAAFSRLVGHLAYIWFRDRPDGPPVRPHARSDAEALDELVQALADYEPRSDILEAEPGTAPPDTMPEVHFADTTAGGRFYAVRFGGAVPGSTLFTRAGFDIGLAYTTQVTAPSAWRDVQRLVDRHDRPRVDVLLVTAGGPDDRGNVYPSEEVAAQLLIEHPQHLARSPTHIKEVLLHSWGTGTGTRLFPAVEPLFGPLYASQVPVHQPLSVTSEPVPHKAPDKP